MPDENTQQKATPIAPPDDGVRELRPVTIFNGQNSGVTKDFRPRQESADAPAPSKATTAPPAREEDAPPRIPTPPALSGKETAPQGGEEPPVPPVEPTEEPPLIPDPADDDGKPKSKKK